MKHFLLVALLLLVGGCTQDVEQNLSFDLSDVQRITLDTLLSAEDIDITQEQLGRAIVAAARGWTEWPGAEQQRAYEQCVNWSQHEKHIACY